MIPKSCLLMHLIIVHFETGLVKRQTLRNIYIWIKSVFKSGKFFWLCIVMLTQTLKACMQLFNCYQYVLK